MAELIGIYDGGFERDKRGRRVGVIHFRISTREGAPETLTAHCLPNFKDAVIKSLRRLAFVGREDGPSAGEDRT